MNIVVVKNKYTHTHTHTVVQHQNTIKEQKKVRGELGFTDQMKKKTYFYKGSKQMR